MDLNDCSGVKDWTTPSEAQSANSTAPAAPPPGAATAERGTEPSEMARLLVFLVAKLAKEQTAGEPFVSCNAGALHHDAFSNTRV